ncbi:Sec-independent protein translocase subunit TatB [Tessaracoccus rhinocerotis]|uniref:Sec-independent protein translocase subunit TatB n=1 Tax=Tessaracoccus rhinocerotis TaxID=1689449 RepID=A0A553K252_9ACTN|nr:sec-independent translocase [Tessaracoccus rhinocerotis]TRY18783.1 Sec-independent protein translocase subunit TatB [Tessaracoccus rhinocerotis]
MFGIDAVELVLLIALAVILFGPEKLPQFAKKAARVVVYLRGIANNAQTQLRSELGPEYADLEIKDLNPKAFVAKHMSAEIQAIEEARADLANAKTTVTSAATMAKQETRSATTQAAAAIKDKNSTAAATVDSPVLFDDEAT